MASATLAIVFHLFVCSFLFPLCFPNQALLCSKKDLGSHTKMGDTCASVRFKEWSETQKSDLLLLLLGTGRGNNKWLYSLYGSGAQGLPERDH